MFSWVLVKSEWCIQKGKFQNRNIQLKIVFLTCDTEIKVVFFYKKQFKFIIVHLLMF